MTRLPCCAALIGLALLQSTVASADTQCSFGVKFKPLEVQPVTLRVRELPIGIVFTVLEKMTGTHFRVPAELDYKATFDIRHAPPCHALQIIGESLGLTYRQEGEAIVVIPPEPAPPPFVPSAVPKQQ
jgi:hypothetical protein